MEKSKRKILFSVSAAIAAVCLVIGCTLLSGCFNKPDSGKTSSTDSSIVSSSDSGTGDSSGSSGDSSGSSGEQFGKFRRTESNSFIRYVGRQRGGLRNAE